MSIPTNPLNESGSTSYFHILVAFKYAEDAFKVKNFNPEITTVGEYLPDVGPNVVVVNETLDQRFSIPEAIWDFDFTPCIGVSTSTSVGKIMIADRFVAYNFIGFLQKEVLGKLNSDESNPNNIMSLSQATFMLRTVFTLEQPDSGSLTDNENSINTVNVNPYYFNIDSIESVPAESAIAPESGAITPPIHILHVMGTSNTTGLMRSFSSMFQMNITHKDGNVHTKTPVGTGT